VKSCKKGIVPHRKVGETARRSKVVQEPSTVAQV